MSNKITIMERTIPVASNRFSDIEYNVSEFGCFPALEYSPLINEGDIVHLSASFDGKDTGEKAVYIVARSKVEGNSDLYFKAIM